MHELPHVVQMFDHREGHDDVVLSVELHEESVALEEGDAFEGLIWGDVDAREREHRVYRVEVFKKIPVAAPYVNQRRTGPVTSYEPADLLVQLNVRMFEPVPVVDLVIIRGIILMHPD